MKNRFQSLIRNLREAGDDVRVFTPDPHAPAEYCGAKVVSVLGFKLPFYKCPTLLLSLGLSVNVLRHLLLRRPDVIHVSAPGLMVFAAALYAKMLRVPLVVSYHTHIPEYIPRYTWQGLVAPMWSIIRWCTRVADLSLVTSQAMKRELSAHACRAQSIDVWPRGVDTEVFHPRFRCPAMRARLSGGRPEDPLLLYVGRLGAEKNLTALREVMAAVPGCRLALVGDGPQRGELERHFEGLPVAFMGMLRGEELSSAYASADVFVMPSETETLGFVVLEAMASGLPVVAVAAGGLPDILAPSPQPAQSPPPPQSPSQQRPQQQQPLHRGDPAGPASSASGGPQHSAQQHYSHSSAAHSSTHSRHHTEPQPHLRRQEGAPCGAAACGSGSSSPSSSGANTAAYPGGVSGGGSGSGAAPLGYLYAPGDYAAAGRLVAALAGSPELRAAVGAAARAEVERYGWGEATRVLREQQYRRAMAVNQGRRRFRWLALRVGLARRLAACLALLWGALLAAGRAAIYHLDYARHLRGPQPSLA